jgi:hypothetical protein
MRDVWAALISAGLGPEDSATLDPGDSLGGEDLLPSLILAWKDAVESRSGKAAKSAARALDLLQCFQQAGAMMTRGFPGIDPDRSGRWLGDRLVWWPQGVPPGRRVGLVSSRLGRNVDRQRLWFGTLRTACMKLDPEHDLIVTSDSIAPHRFVQRGGALFGVPVLNVLIDRTDNPSMRRWGQRVLASGICGSDFHCAATLSPPLSEAAAGRVHRDLADLPLADRVIAAICDQLIALRVRPDGNLERLLAARLGQGDFAAASVFLALGPDSVRPTTAARLMDSGAVGWYVIDSGGPSPADKSPPWKPGNVTPERSAPIIRCPTDKDWPYLTHCTRRQSGPWPDEEEDAYLDSLILDCRGVDHSAFAALWRIVRSGRLLATRGLIRGDTSVVSFTAVPLNQIHHLRTFRSHLSRWDFEPYGICIRREWLQKRGTCPVRYGDQTLWEELNEEERPFFQKSESRSGSGTVVDWTVEKEWRHIDDLELSEIPDDAAILFVPSQVEAEQLSAISRWPVVNMSAGTVKK